MCVVPLYLEEDLAVDTVRFWHAVVERKLVDRVVLVTTAKETPARGPSTRTLVEDELRLLAADPERISLLHCEEVARFRAAQLNLAVEDARARYLCGGGDGHRLWIGVYNADSRPVEETFGELFARGAAEPDTPVFQQLVDYVVPARGRTGSVAVGNSVLQTWWTMSHYVARNARGRSGATVWSRTSPYSTFGHGEFARADFLDRIGGFPDFAYADGLLFGWICRLAGEPVGLLAARDVAEVPRSAADLVLQQKAWLRGLLNFDATARWCRERGLLGLTEREVKLLWAQHLAIPAGWGLSTAIVGAAFATSVRRVIRGRMPAYDLGVLAALAAYPVIPALVPTAGHHRTIGTRRRVVGALASWPVEGLAFWPALRSRLGRDQQAPAKTPR